MPCLEIDGNDADRLGDVYDTDYACPAGQFTDSLDVYPQTGVGVYVGDQHTSTISGQLVLPGLQIQRVTVGWYAAQSKACPLRFLQHKPDRGKVLLAVDDDVSVRRSR